jgi:hypothetical protein
MRLRTTRLVVLLFLCGAAERGSAFAPFGYTWNFGREVIMHLDLEGPAQILRDGSSSWAESATSAMNIWNAQMNAARLVPANAAAPGFFGDKVNTVQFSDTFYGQSFGNNVLAVTLVDRVYAYPSALCEAEVFFNKAKRFDSYRGPLQTDQNGPVFDFRRVAIHEFGHVLGLLHPDEHDQSVVSIMNSIVSDLDNLAADDITGIRSLYWVEVIGNTVSADVTLAQPFSYQVAAPNGASSFSANGLPPGLNIDMATGIISGKPLKSGTYDIQVAAYGPAGTATGSLRITIPRPQITSSPVVYPILGQPFAYQIQTDLEPIGFEVEGELPPGLTLDPQSGLISGIPTISGGNPNGINVVARSAYESARLNIAFIVFFPLPPTDPPLRFLDFSCDTLVPDPVRRRIYGVMSPQFLRVIDGDTLEVMKEFPCEGISGVRITNDGHSLWIFRNTLKRLARLDLDALDQIVDVPTIDNLNGILEGLDGRFYTLQGNDILQLATPAGPVQQRITLTHGLSSLYGPQIALSPDKKTLFLAETDLVGGGSFDTYSAISRYDVSSAVPIFVQRAEMPAPNVQFTVGPEGSSIYVKLGHFDGSRHAWQRTLCVSAQDLTVTKGTLNYEGEAGPLSFSPDGKLALQMVQLGDGGSFTTGLLHIFDTSSFALRKTIVLGSAKSFSFPLSNAVYDTSGARIIAGAGLGQEYTEYRLAVYSAQLPPLPPPAPSKTLLNLSTRLKTLPGDDSLIGGFIVTGVEPKKVIVRAIGPTLPLPGKLLDPTIDLHGPNGKVITGNDNWNEYRDVVLAAGIAPKSDYESAVVATLDPGPYTAVVSGTGNSSGIAVFEIYDLSASATSKLANIATRGRVDGGDNVMIGGLIVGGNETTEVVIRALGPSLKDAGVSSALPDPMLEVYDGYGVLLAQDDDWRQYHETQLLQKNLAPTDDRESGILLSLQPGAYTAIVRGKNGGTGVGLVEVYNLNAN